MDRRLVLASLFVPVAFYAYACSSSDDGGGSPAEPDSGATSSSSGGSSSGSTSSSSSGGTGDAGQDSGDSGGGACNGNPLSADGTTPDGGVKLSADAGAAVVRTAVMSTDTFVDGPVYTDLFAGGALVYSEVFGIGHRVVHVGADGGSPVGLVDSPGNGATQSLPVGNATRGSYVLTTIVPQGGPTNAQILQTLPDGGDGGSIAFPNTVTIHDPNDLVVTKNNVVFFTDPGFQSGSANNGLYRLMPDGGVASVKAYDTNGDRPDGIALSPDEKTLYVSFGIGRRIDRFTLDANGNATLVATPFPAAFPDLNPQGIATDTAGNLWVAESPISDNQNGGRVSVWDPNGNRWGAIEFPNHRPIALAFGGGADNKALYVLANRIKDGGSPDAYVFIYSARCSGVR